jgi:hypothetical protein
MPDNDGVVELPLDVCEIPINGEVEMPVDLPENVAASLMKEGSEGHQALMADIRHNGANVHSLVRHAAFKHYNEIDSVESRANSGVLATPIAGPTTQQP